MTTLNSRFRFAHRRRFTLGDREERRAVLVAWSIIGLAIMISVGLAMHADHLGAPSLKTQIATTR